MLCQTAKFKKALNHKVHKKHKVVYPLIWHVLLGGAQRMIEVARLALVPATLCALCGERGMSLWAEDSFFGVLHA